MSARYSAAVYGRPLRRFTGTADQLPSSKLPRITLSANTPSQPWRFTSSSVTSAHQST